MDREKPFCHRMDSKCCDISLKVACSASWELSLFGLSVAYDAARGELKCQDKAAPVQGCDGFVELRMIVDTVYAEVFADQGSVFMGMTYVQDSNLNRLRIASDAAVIEQLTIAEMSRFWE